jgi:ferredoxin
VSDKSQKGEDGIFSRVVRAVRNRKKKPVQAGTPQKAGAERFAFPGERMMVERPDDKKMPGERTMVSAPEPTGGDAPKKKKEIKARKRAVKCDMCRDYDFMGCVYNCPTGAAKRVDPTEYFFDLTTPG